MKKILSISLALVLLSAVASAQSGPGHRLHNQRTEGLYNKHQGSERFELRKDRAKVGITQRHARRDGRITPMERRRIHKARLHTRHHAFRYRHNGHRRMI
jgi:hypothetical protein